MNKHENMKTEELKQEAKKVLDYIKLLEAMLGDELSDLPKGTTNAKRFAEVLQSLKPPTYFTIGVQRANGDFEVMATLSNNEERFLDEEFESLTVSLMVEMYDRMERTGNSDIVLVSLRKQNAPDYLKAGTYAVPEGV